MQCQDRRLDCPGPRIGATGWRQLSRGAMRRRRARTKQARWLHGAAADVGTGSRDRNAPHGPGTRVAVRRGGAGVRDGERGWGDAAHRLGALHHRMAADHGRRATAVGCRVAGGAGEVSPDPAIPACEQGHEPGRVQAHLLVGVDASVPGALRRRRFPAAVSLFPGDRPDCTRPGSQARRAVRAGRSAGRHRLVHGALRPLRAHRCQPIPAGGAPLACRRDFCRAALDRLFARRAQGAKPQLASDAIATPPPLLSAWCSCRSWRVRSWRGSRPAPGTTPGR